MQKQQRPPLIACYVLLQIFLSLTLKATPYKSLLSNETEFYSPLEYDTTHAEIAEAFHPRGDCKTTHKGNSHIIQQFDVEAET